ncbi:MAG: anti-sigma factor family protein [Planctomycetota bacterium]
MLCSEFDARMHKLLDERKAPEQDSVLRCHAQNCPRCAARLETMVCLLDSLALSETPALPPEFAQRVVESVDQHPTARASSTRGAPTRLLPLMVMAASLLLIAVPLAWYAMKPEDVVVRSPSRPSPPPKSEATKTISSPTRVPTGANEGWLLSDPLSELYSQTTRERHREQMNRLADDLRPIATPFNAALTAIRRSIPVDTSEAEGEPHAAAPPAASPHVSWSL